MAEVAILVTGEPVETVQTRRGSWPTLIRNALGEVSARFVEIDAREPLPSLEPFRAVVVTGSAASVTSRADWIVSAERRLANAVRAGTPIFGICFGHQMLAQALGGEVARNPRGREIGTVRVDVVAADPLLAAAGDSFLANMTHVDAVVRLPENARVLGRSRLDPCSMIRFAENVWGVQFHPEIDQAVMLDYIDARSSVIREEGLDLETLRSEARPAPVAQGLLRQFVELALTARK